MPFSDELIYEELRQISKTLEGISDTILRLATAPKESLSSSNSASALMTRKEAAQYLGVSRSTLSIWHSTGRYRVPLVKVGRCVRYRKQDLDEFLKQRMKGG